MNTDLKKWLEDYENYQPVESVSMGGLGEGYESAIQSLIASSIRKIADIPVPEDIEMFRQTVRSRVNESVSELNSIHGFSGAQVGAASNIVSVFWRKGPTNGMNDLKKSQPERIIKIHKISEKKAAVINYKSEENETD